VWLAFRSILCVFCICLRACRKNTLQRCVLQHVEVDGGNVNSFHLFPHLIEEIYFAELARFCSVRLLFFDSVAIGLRAVTVGEIGGKSLENRWKIGEKSSKTRANDRSIDRVITPYNIIILIIISNASW